MHRHHRPVAAVHTFNFAGDQTVGNIVAAQTAVLLGHRDAQQAHVAHFLEDTFICGFVREGVNDAGLQFFLSVGARTFLDHALVFGQLFAQAEGIRPIKAAHVWGVFGFQYGQFGAHLISSSGFRFAHSIAKHAAKDYRWLLLNL